MRYYGFIDKEKITLTLCQNKLYFVSEHAALWIPVESCSIYKSSQKLYITCGKLHINLFIIPTDSWDRDTEIKIMDFIEHKIKIRVVYLEGALDC